VEDRFGITEEADAVRADHQTGREVTKHRPQTQTPEKWRGNHRRSEERNRVLQPQSTVRHSFRRHQRNLFKEKDPMWRRLAWL
jgi:hypothetical protein